MNIRELAKEAGVSVATISRVINHPEAVLPETRERVQTIIEKNTTTTPKPVNRGRRAVTLIVPAAKRAQTLLSGVQSVLAPKGILVNLVEFSPLSGGIAACIQAAAAAKPLGMPIAGEPSLPPEALPAELPVVLLGSYDRLKTAISAVSITGTPQKKMVSHLHTMGHRSIWLLQSSGESRKGRHHRRLPAGGGRAGLTDRQCRVLEAEDSVVGGYRICREEILTEKPPQAVFAVSDELAMGVIKAAREENIPLPEGLAVAGFTGSEAAAVITPALTTMEHPLERLGAVAARRLIELIEDSALYQVETHEIVLKSKLKIRRSCGNRKEITSCLSKEGTKCRCYPSILWACRSKILL